MPKKKAAAARKPRPPRKGIKLAKRGPSDPEQYKRFMEAAAEAEASDDPKEFDRAFKGTMDRAKRGRN
jgi:hypothetical protein